MYTKSQASPKSVGIFISLNLLWCLTIVYLSTGCTANENSSQERGSSTDSTPQAAYSENPSTPDVVDENLSTALATSTRRIEESPGSTEKPLTPTPVSTSTAKPPPTNTPTATIKPSPTMAGKCDDRIPSDDLLTIVTSEYAISSEYIPGDLVDLSGYLPLQITQGYPTQLREVVVPSLLRMIADMQEAGLQPQIISGYRSYAAQAIAWRKWQEREPDRVAIISVPPGHSEHQLGTTLDFGSPELAGLVGEEGIEFHTYFYKTSEGAWLQENAHQYGFTLSYPLDAMEVTGFYYEPWHYRYIGVELASQLMTDEISLTEYLLDSYPTPCIP